MPICTYLDRVIFFAHIPKTGGTSVEAYLQQKGEISLFGEPKIGGVHLQHLARDTVAGLPDLPQFDQCFGVVRDPVSRMVSEFMWRSAPLKPLQRLARPWDGPKARRIKVRGTKHSLTFAEWVPLALDEARENPNMRDNHMLAQCAFLAKGDWLFLFENGLQPVFRWIDENTDGRASPSVKRLKASHVTKPTVDDASREQIEQFYQQDVALHQSVVAGRTTF
ncbi:sulfotransferase family 2 domain-containing protein [uncultured Pelagimonas sp.]|uniref:sulfotransferase family 2 domain-containing protein n=1 Tax=uncultured Pelagimonas sp. TaxID=1618102 RepID=UPI0026281440|nr:sulfotransferase family 2 domain-containing protein [uncultured Pelagimonas sp.]